MVSDKPYFTKEYCHPFRYNNPALDHPDYVSSVFGQSSRLFKDLVRKRKVCLPLCLLFEKERDQYRDIFVKKSPRGVARGGNKPKTNATAGGETEPDANNIFADQYRDIFVANCHRGVAQGGDEPGTNAMAEGETEPDANSIFATTVEGIVARMEEEWEEYQAIVDREDVPMQEEADEEEGWLSMRV